MFLVIVPLLTFIRIVIIDAMTFVCCCCSCHSRPSSFHHYHLGCSLLLVPLLTLIALPSLLPPWMFLARAIVDPFLVTYVPLPLGMFLAVRGIVDRGKWGRRRRRKLKKSEKNTKGASQRKHYDYQAQNQAFVFNYLVCFLRFIPLLIHLVTIAFTTLHCFRYLCQGLS